MFVNDRYSIFDEDGKHNTFGFVLDAEALVTESNVLVGPDLLNEYRAAQRMRNVFCSTKSRAQKCLIDCSRCARWSCYRTGGC